MYFGPSWDVGQPPRVFVPEKLLFQVPDLYHEETKDAGPSGQLRRLLCLENVQVLEAIGDLLGHVQHMVLATTLLKIEEKTTLTLTRMRQ
eukprot:4949877-Amphidinium_carterae.1